MITRDFRWTPRARVGAALLLVTFAACGGQSGASNDDVGPVGVGPGASAADEVEADLDVPATCDDVGAENDWDDVACETGGNGACQGNGVATADCDHCCEAPPPPACADIAAANGWKGFACEGIDDDACYGLGVSSSDCDVCCEASPTPPTCADVAADWGFDSPACETGGNDACGGDGPQTSDCDHCCDASDAADVPPPPPPPSVTCGMVATQNGWPSPKCEYDGNNACNGQGPQTTDCDHCCSGTGAVPPPSGCGNGTCDAGETCASCAADCGVCLRVVEYDAEGVGDKKGLYKAMKTLRSQSPAILGLEGVGKHQTKFLSKRLGLEHRHFAPTKSGSSGKLGVAMMSTYSLRHFHAKRLPGKKNVLARADVRTHLGEIPFGVTWLDDGSAKLDASKVKHVLGDGHAMLAFDLGGSEFGATYHVLETHLADGWNGAWGHGHTESGKRDDFIFRGASWEPPVSGKVVGTKAGSHAPLIQDYHLTELGRECDSPTSLHAAADLADKPIGTATSGWSLTDAYDAVLVREFDLITAQAYFGEVEPTRGTFDYCIQDRVYDFAKANGKLVRIHPLVWAPTMKSYHSHEAKMAGSESWITPKWLVDLPASEMDAALENHIKNVVQHYRAKGGGPNQYVVVNEALDPSQSSGYRDSVYWEKMGESYIEKSFRWARHYDPTASLAYNDYDIEGGGTKSDLAYHMVEKLAKTGVPIDTVGFQMHYFVSRRNDPNWTPDALRNNIRRYATIRHANGHVGVKVTFTELDLQGAASAEEKKQLYKDLVGVCATEPNCEGVTVWGMTDAEAFDAAGGNMLFTNALQPRGSTYGGVIEGLLEAAQDMCIGWRPGVPPSVSVAPPGPGCGG